MPPHVPHLARPTPLERLARLLCKCCVYYIAIVALQLPVQSGGQPALPTNTAHVRGLDTALALFAHRFSEDSAFGLRLAQIWR
jgi:hypothetical protein